MNSLVSVNITTYNRAHLLPRCLDSVLNQSYKNTEIVIVDDCSEDNTEQVVKNYILKDNRIKYIKHKKNKGNAFARNTALKNCTGYYVAFMDDDDEWIDNDKLKKQIKIFEDDESEKIGIICSNVRVYTSENEFKDKIIKRPKNLKKWILKRNGIIYNSTVVTKKEILEKVGGFDENLKRGIDSDFYRSCILNLECDVYFMEDITVAYREYGDDRITPQDNYKAIKTSIDAQKYIIRKNFKWFLRYPFSFLFRLRIIIKSYLNILRIKNEK